MGGMKSGTGDDLWGDDDDDSDEAGQDDQEQIDTPDETVGEQAATGETETDPTEETATKQTDTTTETDTEKATDTDPAGTASDDSDSERPYIVRRALQDENTQFERSNRLTFFVHDDVESGERDLLRAAEDRFDRDVPKFDIREAAYRAAIRNPDAVLRELERMGYEQE